MRINLCGVRGSVPATGDQFTRIGGNTSCVALSHDGDQYPSLVLDAGTGLRRLSDLFADVAFSGSILLGHLHWDHVFGLPFFPAGNRPDARVQVLLPEQGVEAELLLTRLMSPPFFPITPSQLRGDWSFNSFEEGTFELEGFSVMAREIPHGGGRTMGLRVSDGHSSVAYLSDHSPQSLGPGADGLGELHEAAMELASGVDLLIHEAQYTTGEHAARIDWGHSTANYAVTLASRCGAAGVLLFHHDPSRTDDEVDALRGALDVPEGLRVDVAVEGTVITL